MDQQLKPKYGLITAIAMVVGIVIGSGVFFKSETVLNKTGGNLPLGILAWIVGGAIMIIFAYTFSILATRHSGVGGLVDYADVLVGKPYAYVMGWFVSFVYYPAMTSVLSWVTARYFGALFGWSLNDVNVMTLSFAFMILSYAVNTLSPIIAGKIQVSTTVIKLIPLGLMAICGTVVGLVNGTTVENFTNIPETVPGGSSLKAFFGALIAAAFAYEGWTIAVSINAEIKNPKKNLPLALVIGTFIIAAAYILYYIGLAGSVKNEVLMASGENGVKTAFEGIFGKVGGVGLRILIVISCFGTLNGLMLANTRSVYSLAARGNGIKPHMFSRIDEHTNMPTNSAVLAIFITMLWLLFFYGANLAAEPWFGKFSFDSSELPIITIYALYIPILIMMMKKEKDLGVVKRFVFPSLCLALCAFMMYATVSSHGIGVLWYLIAFALIMSASIPFYKKKAKKLSD